MMSTNKLASKTVRLEQQLQPGPIYAKLVELGVSEKWLKKSNPTKAEARDLLKGLLYLKELYPNNFKDK